MSLEDTGTAAGAVVESVSAPPPSPTPSPTPEAAPAGSEADTDAALMRVWDKFNPPQGADGKFVSKNPPVEGVEVAADTQSPDTPAPASPEPAQPAIEAPHAWSGEMKAKWSSLPPEVQTYVSQREGEAHKAITRAGERVKQFEPLSQVLQQHQDTFSRHGASPEQGIAFLLDAQRKLDANPAQALVEIGASYGFDLRPLVSGQPGQAEAPRGPDPMVQQLQSRLNQVEGQLTARQKAEQEAQASEVDRLVAEFAKKQPHYADVEADMLELLPGMKAANPELSRQELLAKAYEKATWANPTVRQRILEDQRKAEEEKREAEAKAKAEQARKAGSVNVRGGFAQPSPKSLDDQLAEVARKHYR